MPEEQDIPKQPLKEESSPDILVEAPSVSASETQFQNMEVHHHPDLHHKHKKWKEYFLEFLMIFLAVVMGFFAESYREHLTDQTKEKEYIQSLIEDLKTDQNILSQHIAQVKSGLFMTDSMIVLLNNHSSIADKTGLLYYFARLTPRLWPLSINSRTLEQLKNSGNFRLIRNLATSNKIMNYYEKLTLIHLLESINESEFTEYKKVAAKIFDPNVFLQMEDDNGNIKRISDNPPLRHIDDELLQELSVFAVYMHGTKKSVIKADENLKIEGENLIGYLQKEYHL
jgi:hypothetical protein